MGGLNSISRAIISFMKTPQLKRATELIRQLQAVNINPVLYGSLGVSYYLGQFKPNFGDIDLLVPDKWLESDWAQMQKILSSLGFSLFDLHEHEFIDASKQRVQFAKESVLIRDNVLNSLDEIITVSIGDLKVRTLTANGFKNAYGFSIKDGYRRDTGKKDDATVIALLDAYINGKN